MDNLALTMKNTMVRVMLEGDTGGGGSFIKEFFTNASKYVKSLGSYIVLIIGIALILAAAWMLFKAFASGNSNSNWVVIVLCLFVGGILSFGGWKLITNGQLGNLGKDTMTELMDGASEGEDFNGNGGSGGTCVDKARAALGIIANEFVMPFGTALALWTGVALVLLAIVQIAKFFFAGGRAQTSWLKVGAMFVIGVVMFVGTGDEGFKWARKIGLTSKDTIINMSKGDENETNGLNYGDLSTYDPGDGSTMSADPDDV